MNSPDTHCIAVAINDKHVPAEAVKLAIEMADEVAACDLECICELERDPNGFEWFDLNSPEHEFDKASVAKAAQYLELRGQLIKHETKEGWVRFPRTAA